MDGLEELIQPFETKPYHPVFKAPNFLDGFNNALTNAAIFLPNTAMKALNDGIVGPTNFIYREFTNPGANPSLDDIVGEAHHMIDVSMDFATEDPAGFLTDVKNETIRAALDPESYSDAVMLFLAKKVTSLGGRAGKKIGTTNTAKQGEFVFKTTMEEGNLKFIEVKIRGEVLEFGGDFVKKDKVLTIKNFDVDGNMTNKLGITKIKEIMSDFDRQQGVTKVITEGAPRTTGANPGKITKLTFDVQ